MIKYLGQRMTANQAAKCLVADHGESAEYWSDGVSIDVKALTNKEEMMLHLAVTKQIDRVREYLGIDKIRKGA